MADPSSHRERNSNLALSLQTVQANHDAGNKYDQQTIDDLIEKQKALEQKNISLEADIKLLKMALLRDPALVLISQSDLDTLTTSTTRLREDLDVLNDKIEKLETSINGQ